MKCHGHQLWYSSTYMFGGISPKMNPFRNLGSFSYSSKNKWCGHVGDGFPNSTTTMFGRLEKWRCFPWDLEVGMYKRLGRTREKKTRLIIDHCGLLFFQKSPQKELTTSGASINTSFMRMCP